MIYNYGFEKKFYQIEWQNIRFEILKSELDETNLPTNDFYNEFYYIFFNNYKYYFDLPETWLNAKKNTATSIYKNLNGGKEILSFGCGIGFIETIIAEQGDDLSIDAFDFSEISSKWIKNSTKVNSINFFATINK